MSAGNERETPSGGLSFLFGMTLNEAAEGHLNGREKP